MNYFITKVKTGRGGMAPTKGHSGDDNSELNADENASTISNASTNMSYQDLDLGYFCYYTCYIFVYENFLLLYIFIR